MESTSSDMNYILGLILGMLLYMIIIIYGQMVLTSVVEEKASRVIDVMVTSATPFQLMMGKILGIAAVAVTQIAIWAVLVISASKFLLPALMPADAAASGDAMLSAVLGTIGDAGYLAMIFTYMLLFILGGFLLYASLYAASGSAVDSVQDGQQFNSIIMMPIIISIIVMMARIPFGIPTWEIILSLILLYATFLFTTWLAAKIFRVGIFMHGKRPSWSELWQWVRSR